MKLSFAFLEKSAIKSEKKFHSNSILESKKAWYPPCVNDFFAYFCQKIELPENMKKDNNSELLPIVNETGEVIGNATRGQCHDGTKLLHPVVHLHLFDSQGRLYLQHRPLWKTIQPGKWDTAVGGHVDYGEDVPTALKREVVEELGIADCEPRFLRSYLFESEREKELVYVYSTVYDGAVSPSEELDGGRFWTLDEIKSAMGQEVLTPNFEMEFLKVMEWMNL